ncbi:uncharacterized protein TNCV_4346031 [Trichonephila clavipes]|nr:uncharacterized protein TNCV_4346031 [Trichonephila clavipes]
MQTSMPSPGFEPRPYVTAVSVTNHYTGWVAKGQGWRAIDMRVIDGTIFWARHRSKRSTAIDSSIKEFSFTCRNCGGGDRGRVAIYRPFGEVSLSLNRTVTCMVLKANDRRTSCPCHNEFRGPRSDYVRQVALATTTTT